MSSNIFDIQTIDDFYDYIEIELGSPVIDQEMDIKHLEHSVKKAIQFYIDKSGIGSTAQKTIKLLVTDPHNIELPSGVTSVGKIYNGGKGNANFDTKVLFDKYALSCKTPSRKQRYDLVSKQIYGEYMTLIENHFSGGTIKSYSSDTNILNMNPTPKVGDELIIEVNMSFDWNSPIYFNNIWVQEYAVALAKKYWGWILLKYENRGLTGGATINARDIHEAGVSGIEKLEQEFIDQNTFSGYMSVG